MIYNRMSLSERVGIQVLLSKGQSIRDIGRSMGRSPSTISREIRHAKGKDYNAEVAQWYAQQNAHYRKSGKRKLTEGSALLGYVKEKLSLRWSPKQISVCLVMDFPDDDNMRISHESIYAYVYVHSKKGLRECLIKSLRQEKKKRGAPRAASEDKRGKIPNAISIDERPEEVLGREIPGHWEGDLINGKGHQSAIGTLAERTTRTVIIIPLQSYDAQSVRKAMEEEFARIPRQMRKTMTYDNGKEMAEHELLAKNSKIKVYFAHPYSPWERPTNENTNGLIRDYFPKGTDFNTITPERLKEVQHQLNERPRKVLNWYTPKEVFHQLCGMSP
jgi:IS30 family transposase